MQKIALIGAGRIGRIHAANVAAHPELQLAYVIDPVAASAKSVADSFSAKTADLDGALGDASVSGVIVASSTDTHLDFSLRAAQAGKAIFCEKPIDLDLQRAQGAASKFEAARASMFLAFNRRFDPNFRTLKAKLDKGEVGKLETLHITSHDPSPTPAGYIPVSGGLFKDMAIHDFDMARWLLGEVPSEVFAAGACLLDPEIRRLGDIDTAKTILRTPSGKLCVISNSRRSGYGYDQRIEAFGSGGLVRADNLMQTSVSLWRDAGMQSDVFQNFFLDRYADAYRRELAHFVDVIAGKTAPAVSFADGVAALALAEAAADSTRTGKPVRLA